MQVVRLASIKTSKNFIKNWIHGYTLPKNVDISKAVD